MIYFLINNNYHFYDVSRHLSAGRRSDPSLILVPHALHADNVTGFTSVFTYSRPSRPGLIPEMRNHLQQVRRFDREVRPDRFDTLFVYTELDLINQHVIARFKERGAKVFLIEDGGLGTYLPFRMLASEPLSAKELAKQWVYRRLPKLSSLRFHKLNGHVFRWMPEASFDGVCLYRPVDIKRNIPVFLVRRPATKHIIPNAATVVFLNEPMYLEYQKPQHYLEGLTTILKALRIGFRTVHFKFHPRESTIWRQRIYDEVLSKISSINLIKDDSGIEDIIDSYRPSVAASYFSVGLFNLLDQGIEPLYLYHLIPDLSSQPIFREASSVLQGLGYRFITDFGEANSLFRSGLMGKCDPGYAISLWDLIS